MPNKNGAKTKTVQKQKLVEFMEFLLIFYVYQFIYATKRVNKTAHRR